MTGTAAGVGTAWPRSDLLAAGAVTIGCGALLARSLKLAPGSLPNGAGLDLAGLGDSSPGENRAAVSVIWQWLDARTQAVVWPPALATHPLQAIPILP